MADTRKLEGVTYRYNFVTDKRDKARNSFSMRSKVKRFPGMEAWHFAEVPVKTSAQIKKIFGHMARGWGSLRVQAVIGDTSWKSSIFPDKKSKTYVLPLKIAVRKAEGITSGKTIALKLEVL